MSIPNISLVTTMYNLIFETHFEVPDEYNVGTFNIGTIIQREYNTITMLHLLQKRFCLLNI